jgi:hypothetical protein
MAFGIADGGKISAETLNGLKAHIIELKNEQAKHFKKYPNFY